MRETIPFTTKEETDQIRDAIKILSEALLKSKRFLKTCLKKDDFREHSSIVIKKNDWRSIERLIKQLPESSKHSWEYRYYTDNTLKVVEKQIVVKKEKLRLIGREGMRKWKEKQSNSPQETNG